MEKLSKIFLFFCILQCLSLSKTFAATTYDWTGAAGTSWNTPGNWKVGGTVQTINYPGVLSTDIAQISVNNTFTNQPVIASPISIATLIIGTQTATTLTINAALTVSGDITVQNNDAAGGTATNLSGSGSIACTNFNLGDNTKPPTPLIGLADQTYPTILNFSSLSLSVSNNLVITTTSSSAVLNLIYSSANVDNPAFNFNSGTITIGNLLKTSDPNDINLAGFTILVVTYTPVSSSAQFLMHPTAGNTALLNLNGANALSLDGNAGYVDFDCSCGGMSTVNYGGSGNQEVYTSAAPYSATGRQSPNGLDRSPSIYQNVTYSGSLTKTADGGNLTVDNDFTLSTSGSETVDLSINNPVVTIGGNLTTNSSTTLKQGSGSITVGGNAVNGGALTLGSGTTGITGNYTNTGTFTSGTGMVTFNGAAAETLTDSGNGTQFINVTFNGGGSKTISSGNFSVSSAGVLTMGSSTALATGGNLTLNSDVNSSATIAALPVGAGITGNVNVQRFIQGSAASTVKRGYRLISSAVYTGTVSGINVYDPTYLLNSVLVSGLGGTANGFNITTSRNSPSLYLFREDDLPPPANSTIFLTEYNWKGIAQINNSPVYNIGTQKKLTSVNLADTTTTIPVGNGLLFFFRGDKTHNLTNKTTAPFAYPEDVTTTQVGSLNTGTVNVKLWFANAANGLGNNLSYTAAYVNSGTSSLRGGYTCVGNPYASTINWEKYNRNGANSSIYGSASLPSTIWIFDEANNQYESYMQKATVSSVADTTTSVNPGTAQGSASNMIASGQGFFIKATAANSQTLSFRETAKTSTQPTAANLHNLMGAPEVGPKEFVLQPDPLFRLKLIKDTVNNDEIVIRMNRQAHTKFVENEDAEDLGGNGALESLSAFSSDSIALSIDYIPFPGKQAEIVPLLVDATASGTYKLDNTQLDNLQPVYQVWLKDAFIHDSLLMKTGATYSFTIDKNNPATFGAKRFAVVIGQDTALSYKLLDFTASRAAATSWVQLAWKTVNEENYIDFTVERSTDGGKTFNIVGGLQATGAGTYSLLDKNPVTGTSLYRLKQEDLNDSITYSKMVALQYVDPGNSAANKIQVYPNPAVNIINVAIAADAGVKPPYTIQITNTSGFVIRQVSLSQQNWQTSVADLMPGTYIIKVHNSTDNSIIGDSKFVKL